MLQIEPMRWFSWDFTVERDGRPIAELDISGWRERGELIVDGVTYAITRDEHVRQRLHDDRARWHRGRVRAASRAS